MKDFAVIFDMDGVLVDNFEYHKQAWDLFCERHGIRLSDEFRSKVFGKTNKEHLETFFSRKLSPDEINSFEQEKEKIYREIYTSHIKPVDGLPEFIKSLVENEFPVALATSSPPVNVRFVLGETGLSPYLKIMVDASMIKKSKPNPEIYLLAASKLKYDPGNCIVFEDSKAGIQAALNAGMKVVAVATTLQENELGIAHDVISDFREINVDKLQKIMI